jgi:hypothetical protein
MTTFEQLTVTARVLSLTVFKQASFPMLRNYGLENVYVDDYGCTKRHENCLFYLYNPNRKVDYITFERGIADFQSFYDWYDVGDKRMYVFKVNPIYLEDYHDIKQNRFNNLSLEFEAINKVKLLDGDIFFDPSKEIFRFEQHLLK